ncbi:MAG: 5-formyltetrahydrofolate cyclo-ligase [Paracoccus sp. (in: a-proteobacteria)]|nr:5-formyltetrahydrofolate cyclo-ligase [Paracoccus sp. (in: a-proteobacteria)]
MPDNDAPPEYASLPCLAGQMARADQAGRDQAGGATWRKATRAHLIAAREGMGAAPRRAAANAIAAHLDEVLEAGFDGAQGMVLAAFWPIRAEVDLRPWMAAACARGVQIALPVVVAKDAPLIFRPWSPDVAMRAGAWNIAEPATETQVSPRIVLAPLVGWDEARFRMGYGGGFYDRTLAASRPRPYAIGIGHEGARLPSIRPEPHDEALDLIITEAGPH